MDAGKFGLMDFVVIGTFLATLIVVVITAFAHFKSKNENSLSNGDDAIADSLREIIRLQSNDFLRVSQEYKESTTRISNELRDHIYTNTLALNRLIDSMDQLNRNILNENNNIKNDIAEINRRIRVNYDKT